MFTRQTVAPGAEPVSLAEAKAHLRVDSSADDALITALIQAAREAAEPLCQRVFISTEFECTLDRFCPLITLDRNPVQAIDSIEYQDTAGTWQTLSATEYAADLATEPARITAAWGKVWPQTLTQIGAVKISFTAGYGDPDDVPAGIKAWMLIRIGSLYENRSETTPGVLSPFPYVDRLLDAYRLVVI